ncbi:MAG: glutaredoxin family protein [Candidatus Shapirobacteria bacterium]|nr:glutaredoxin family protein [Candidatus Shapirobacteria bacterium]
MIKKTFRLWLSLLVAMMVLWPRPVLSQNNLSTNDQEAVIYFFWGEGCPHCSNQKPFLDKLVQKYSQLRVEDFEIYRNRDNQELFTRMAEAYGTIPRGVPMTFIGRDFVVGFGSEDTTGRQIEDLIKSCLVTGCPSPAQVLAQGGLEGFDDSSLPVTQPSPTPIQSTINQIESVCLHLFVNDQCPVCLKTYEYLAKISEDHDVDLKVYNISEDESSQALFQQLQGFYGLTFSGFPIVFMGDSYFLGEEVIRRNLETSLVSCQSEGCPCPVEELKQTLTQMPKINTFTPQTDEDFTVDFFGRSISFYSGSPLYVLGIVLGLVDGINPCMFSVLLFLLTYLLAVGSRKKALKVGLAFALGVFVIYFLFMIGMINLIGLIGFIQRIKTIVAILALAAGVVMVKDFFFYGKWFSLEIPSRAKPAVEKLIKKGTIPSALLLALLSSLVEIPCTSGIPLVYVTLLAQKGGVYLPYLIWYNIFFVLPLLAIIILVSLAWTQADKIEKWRLNFRKYMRLAAGLILVFLGFALLRGWM